MSTTDVPLVAEYRTALRSILKAAAENEHIAQTQNAIDAFRNIRKRNESTEDAPAHDSTVETVVREMFVTLVSRLDIHDSEFGQIWHLIDVANSLSQNDLSEPSLAFYLVEELLDSQTIDGCRKVFDYLESRREQMVRKNFRTTSLVILRCCNELLRRLSRAKETVFCGRVFIYLFQTFPLGDRSSVNLRGVFHTENITTYDEAHNRSEDAIRPMEIDPEIGQAGTSGAQTPSSATQDIDSRTGRNTPSGRPSKSDTSKVEPAPDLDVLYPIFWSLQSLVSDPTRLFDPQSMQQFKEGINDTMSCFKYISRNTTTAAESIDIKRGLKRKRDPDDVYSNGNNMDGDTVKTEDPGAVAASSKFNPKYLTSRDLFDLEVHDLAFRRHFLVQALIMLDFLLSLSPIAKQKTLGLTNRSVLYSHTLSDEDTKWCVTTRSNIASYLQQSGIGSEGSLYYRMVDTVLSRDKNWARWKAENCPPISRPAVSPESYMASQKSLQELSKLPTMVNPLGAADFNFLNFTEPLDTLKYPNKKRQVPSLQDYYAGIQTDDLDLEFAADEKEKAELQEKKAGKLWRALRSATGTRFKLCGLIQYGGNLKALVQNDQVSGDGKLNGNSDVKGEESDDVKMEDRLGDIQEEAGSVEQTTTSEVDDVSIDHQRRPDMRHGEGERNILDSNAGKTEEDEFRNSAASNTVPPLSEVDQGITSNEAEEGEAE